MAMTDRLCAICGQRRPRRYCPGVNGDICTICCGTGREVTVNCPLDCVYLREAREREAELEIDPRRVPNNDIEVTEQFLKENEPLLVLLAASVARSALSTPGVVDGDVREALDSLVQTFRTLQSGLVYRSRPDNPLAARVYSGVEETIEQIRAELAKHGGLRDSTVLGVLVFLQRIGLQRNNGRPKGRAFIDFLRQFFPPDHAEPTTSSGLIVSP
jgi:hypothetical protein